MQIVNTIVLLFGNIKSDPKHPKKPMTVSDGYEALNLKCVLRET